MSPKDPAYFAKRNERPAEETNAHFARTNKAFQKAAEAAGIPPTTRQAAKFRAKKGRAYSAKAAVLS